MERDYGIRCRAGIEPAPPDNPRPSARRRFCSGAKSMRPRSAEPARCRSASQALPARACFVEGGSILDACGTPIPLPGLGDNPRLPARAGIRHSAQITVPRPTRACLRPRIAACSIRLSYDTLRHRRDSNPQPRGSDNPRTPARAGIRHSRHTRPSSHGGAGMFLSKAVLYPLSYGDFRNRRDLNPRHPCKTITLERRPAPVGPPLKRREKCHLRWTPSSQNCLFLSV
jgi:hypothetical protein